MKKILFFVCATLVISCSNKTNEKVVTDLSNKTEIKASQNLDWLLGNWKRLNDEVGNETFENWQKLNELEYQGIGFTMKNSDTLSQENMKLFKSNNEWRLSVSFPTEKTATIFKITQMNEKSFVCENELNDFPKKIKYWLEDQNLKAKISNADIEIDFDFEKVK